jgi:PAS domain S-box-containing protein
VKLPFSPPASPPESPQAASGADTARLSRTLRLLALGCLVAVAPSLFFDALVWRPAAVCTLAGQELLLLAALWLNWRGRVAAATTLITFSLLGCAAILVSISRHGVHDPAMLMFPALLVVAAMLLGWRAYLVFAPLVATLVVAIGLAELHGWTASEMRGFTTYRTLIDQTAILIMTGVVVGLVARTLRDNLTRAQTHAAALAASEARFRSVIELAVDAIFLFDAETLIAAVNHSACTLTGYNAAELVGRSLATLFSEEERRRLPLRFDLLRAGLTAEFARTLTRKDGTTVPVEMRSRMMPDGTFQTFIRDVAERQRTEERLRQAERLESVGRLAGGVAHDFNNLLTVINGYSDLLLDQVNGDARAVVEQIGKAGAQAASLTQQLLAFSRRQVLRPEPIDLNEVVRDAERMLRRLIGEDIELVTTLAPRLGAVMADVGQTHQVLVNLAVNARDAMPRGGRLRIETRNIDFARGDRDLDSDAAPGSYAQLTVGDTGKGMDRDTADRIFEPFFTTKATGEGTGLGLSTVYGIIRQSQGWIRFDSAPGRGTEFRVYLPRLDGASPAVRPAEPDAAPAVGSETILVVEDETEVRDLAARVLARCGYRILTAAAGAEALAVAAAHPGPIHLALTDIVMPGMTGREFADRLVAARPATGVLFTSGYTDDVIAHRGTLGRDVAFLPKPFSPDTLARRVREALDSRPGPPPSAA